MKTSYSLDEREIKEAIDMYIRSKVNVPKDLRVVVTLAHGQDDRTRTTSYGATARVEAQGMAVGDGLE